MTNELRVLIDDTAAQIVREVDKRLLGVNKRQAVEKLLEQFYTNLVALDDKNNVPPTEDKK